MSGFGADVLSEGDVEGGVGVRLAGMGAMVFFACAPIAAWWLGSVPVERVAVSYLVAFWGIAFGLITAVYWR